MPRSHYGYDPPEKTPEEDFIQDYENRLCLDETGYMITSSSANNYTQACFSLTEYYGGLMGFNRVEQSIFLVEGAKSIPYYYYEKKQSPCRIVDSKEAHLEKMKNCSIFLSAENYGMLCCCYKQKDTCHFPNPVSYHFRGSSARNDLLPYRLTCAYGNYSYSDIKKAAEGEAAKVSWLKQENPADDYKLESTGNKCKTVYEFTKTNFIMKMNSESKLHCENPPSKQFLCELQDRVCPGEKPTYTSFSVKCCCGGEVETLDNGEQRIKPEDLCNLDFLSHHVQDNFEEVFNKPLCSYSKYFHRLFGNYYKEGVTEYFSCNVYYDIILNKVVYLLDGNNIEFLYDPSYSQDATYKAFQDNPRRAFYVQKCNLEMKLRAQPDNKDKVMKKCLKYESQKPVSSKADLETEMNSVSSLVHADESFLCFAHIISTVVYRNASENQIHKTMTHKIQAGPVTNIDLKELLQLDPDNIDFQFYSCLGNNNATFFCCCFVGYGWEDCDLKSSVANYVDSYDLRMDEQSIMEVYQGQGVCVTDAVQSPSSRDNQSKNIQESIRNEDLTKCVRPIGCFRIQDLNDHKPKRFEIWAGYKSDYNPPDGYPFALVCCCIGDCKGNAVNELYGLAINDAAKT
uniref:Uncharacterized protein n=1 Tax=Ditylenchus dipsaci TaxID=166011 RepID=A0A915ELZ0_9BILA